MSVGIALAEGGSEGLLDLLRRADAAMYETKRRGRRRSDSHGAPSPD